MPTAAEYNLWNRVERKIERAEVKRSPDVFVHVTPPVNIRECVRERAFATVTPSEASRVGFTGLLLEEQTTVLPYHPADGLEETPSRFERTPLQNSG
ncbi:hypothetical protein DL770_006818 [Monosporascus sp. CRB-9-2]|nr:hypothetical protein DL770_006818 [Monosporascus sp. CRB-9-2]